MPHRLVIFEGIMGSGKSHATLHFAERFNAQPVHENTDPHPVRGTDGLEHWFKPWLDVSTTELAARGLAKWQDFVRRASGAHVMDGQLFHGDFTHLFLMEAAPAELEDYCLGLVEAMRPLDPFLVYFRQDDVPRAIDAVCEARGPEWVKYQTEWKLQFPYCVRRKLAGQQGLARLYADYRNLTDQLFRKLEIPKIEIDTSAGSWGAYYRKIEANL